MIRTHRINAVLRGVLLLALFTGIANAEPPHVVSLALSDPAATRSGKDKDVALDLSGCSLPPKTRLILEASRDYLVLYKNDVKSMDWQHSASHYEKLRLPRDTAGHMRRVNLTDVNAEGPGPGLYTITLEVDPEQLPGPAREAFAAGSLPAPGKLQFAFGRPDETLERMKAEFNAALAECARLMDICHDTEINASMTVEPGAPAPDTPESDNVEKVKLKYSFAKGYELMSGSGIDWGRRFAGEAMPEVALVLSDTALLMAESRNPQAVPMPKRLDRHCANVRIRLVRTTLLNLWSALHRETGRAALVTERIKALSEEDRQTLADLAAMTTAARDLWMELQKHVDEAARVAYQKDIATDILHPDALYQVEADNRVFLSGIDDKTVPTTVNTCIQAWLDWTAAAQALAAGGDADITLAKLRNLSATLETTDQAMYSFLEIQGKLEEPETK